MIKWDGHTHSEFCQHGSGEKTAKLVEKAIDLGFQRYSITEHAPLPPGVIDDPKLAKEFTLLHEELDDYFHHIEELKSVYGDRIEIRAGLELDYIVGYDSFFDTFLKEQEQRLDDIIISLHMIKGKNGISPVDFSPEVFENELVDYYGSVEEVHWAYWSDLKTISEKKIAKIDGKRIGHLGLINKYSKRFPLNYDEKKYEIFFDGFFKTIKKNDWAIDFNVAGLRKELYGGLYVSDIMLKYCRENQIQLIYGSDAHESSSVGKDYEIFLSKYQIYA